MKSTAVLSVEAADARSRDDIAAVLAPDNVGLPRGLKLSSHVSATRLEYRVDAETPSAAVSTVLALLRDIELFQEVWLLSSGKVAATAEDHPS